MHVQALIKYPTQNMLAACTFDLKSTYVLSRWEGIAYDSRIMKSASTRVDQLKIPESTNQCVIILYKASYIHTQFNKKLYFIFRKILSCWCKIHVEKWAYYHHIEASLITWNNIKEIHHGMHVNYLISAMHLYGMILNEHLVSLYGKCFPIAGSSTEFHYGLET